MTAEEIAQKRAEMTSRSDAGYRATWDDAFSLLDTLEQAQARADERMAKAHENWSRANDKLIAENAAADKCIAALFERIMAEEAARAEAEARIAELEADSLGAKTLNDSAEEEIAALRARLEAAGLKP